jgi:hypothetical protein
MSEVAKELRHDLEKDNARLLKRVWSHAKWERPKTLANLMDQNLRLRLMVSIMEGRSVMIRPRQSRRRSVLLEMSNQDPFSPVSRAPRLNGHHSYVRV